VSTRGDMPASIGALASSEPHTHVPETLDHATRMLACDARHASEQLLAGLSEDLINFVDWCV
jgi:hypothetical protein